MKNRLYFSKEKPKVEISYVSIIQSWKEILSYSKKMLILTSSCSR